MKAVLLAAGKGMRLRPITDQVSKPMIKIGGKPFLEYILNDLKECGFDKICIIIGYHGEQIRDYFKNGSGLGVDITYEKQVENLGTADALRYAKEFTGRDNFLLYLADTIIPESLSDFVNNVHQKHFDIDILSAKVAKSAITNVGNIETDQDHVTGISEKSSTSNSNLAWAGIAFFRNDFIFDIISKLNPSHRGEYEITDAMNNSLTLKKKIRNHLCNGFIDSGSPCGLLDAVEFILKHRKTNHKMEEMSHFSVIDPVYIGKNCTIGEDVMIGPYVSVESHSKIGNSVSIERSLILEHSVVEGGQKISRSIVTPSGIIKC